MKIVFALSLVFVIQLFVDVYGGKTCPTNIKHYRGRAKEPCGDDSECADTEKICCSGVCVTGYNTTPKPGSCPSGRDLLRDDPLICRKTFTRCQYDSQCHGHLKCCPNTVCHRTQCLEADADDAEPVLAPVRMVRDLSEPAPTVRHFSVENDYHQWTQSGASNSHATIRRLAELTNTPPEYILLQADTGSDVLRLTLQEEDTPLITADWLVRFRPVVHDHIHIDVEYWIGDKLRGHDHDRPIIQELGYEESVDPKCLTPDDPVAYTKLWPHNGIHTHCDGIIHIHPWSSPYAWRIEGKRVIMQSFFDTVGVRYYETNIGLDFEDGSSYRNNATHKWRMELKKFPGDTDIQTYFNNFNRVWIPYAYGSVRFVYGDANPEWPRKDFGNWGAKGFNGQTYPILTN